MKLAFVPGNLYLDEVEGGYFLVTVRGEEILRTHSRRIAVARFNELRAALEAEFPARELSADQKAQLMTAAISDSLVQHNSLGGRKKSPSASRTRTFGG